MALYFYLLSSLPDFHLPIRTEQLDESIDTILRNVTPEDQRIVHILLERRDHINLFSLLCQKNLKINSPALRHSHGLLPDQLQSLFTEEMHLPDHLITWRQWLKHEGEQESLTLWVTKLRSLYLEHCSQICPPPLLKVLQTEDELLRQVAHYYQTATSLNSPQAITEEPWLTKAKAPSELLEKRLPGLTDLWNALENGQLYQQDVFFETVIENQAFLNAPPYSSMEVFALVIRWTHAYRRADLRQEPERVHLQQLLQELLPQHYSQS